eukprot:GHVU01049178.1.p1 GENE.GHVU01049178.1~~GHVU01049178.1.p1  ORF type:complete len:136 (+),score=26.17 GHVU01049178.1:247-654(+)
MAATTTTEEGEGDGVVCDFPRALDLDSPEETGSEPEEAAAVDAVAHDPPPSRGDVDALSSTQTALALRPPGSDTDRMKLFTCDCYDYWQGKVCYHIILFQAIKGWRLLDKEVAALPNRKRKGRPQKAKTALERQP